MAITRKEFLKLGLVAGGAGLALSCGASASLPGGRSNATTGSLLLSAARLPKPFRVSLPVPAVLEPARSDADADHYEITQKVGKAGWGLHRGSKDYIYPLEQRAATLWYHDHRMDFTGSQVYRGLAGFHIIRDDEEDALPLPKDEKDVSLMICDRSFGEDGSFMYPARDPSLRGNPGVKEHYMVFHRHNLEHEDMMMANFEVV